MTCPSCGQPLPEGARFCPSCGQAVAVRRAGERRVVTVLFADIVGYTALAERLDPEQVTHLVDRCFERLVDDVTTFGGRIDKIMGDAVVALFGAPVAHEDDAERAVRAGLRMQATIADRAAELGVPLRLRVGVNTGEVLVGALRAGGDYTAMGDVVNIAARLQQVAPPGGVVVGPATYAATARAIEFESLGPVEVRGRDEAVPAWRAVAAVALPGRRNHRDRSPLVGREVERALLLDGCRLCTRYERALVTVVEGEAGVGKSRLGEAVVSRFVEQLGGVALVGRCVPYGEPNPWFPLADAFAALGLDRNERIDPDNVRDAVADVLGLDRDDPEVQRVTQGLLHLAGHATGLDEIEPGRAREELGRSVLRMLEALSRLRPVMVVVADLHWADHMVVDLLTWLVDRLGGRPVVFFTTRRPGPDHVWPPAGRHSTIELRLDPLDDAAAERMARALAPDAPDEVIAGLLERSGGNPLFLEELAAALGAGVGEELPGTLRGLVAARIDALSPEARAVLDNAAVLGSEGPVSALHEFAQALGQPSTPALVRVLADTDLLDVDDGHWSFRSELVREVAYGMITKAARAQRHVGVAEHLVSATGERGERAEQIAFHFAAAADLVRELGPVGRVPLDVIDRAVDWLARAAEWNLAQEVLPTAVRLADRGLALLGGADPGDARVRRLLLARAGARAEARDLDGAAADAAVVLDAARAAGDGPAEAGAEAVLGHTARTSGRFAEASAHYRRAMDHFAAAGDLGGQAVALRELGLTAVLAGDRPTAEEALHEAGAWFEEIGDRRGQAWVDQHLAWVAFLRGDTEDAEARLATAAATFSQLGDRGGLGWVRGLLAYLRFQQGRRDEAAALADEVMSEAAQRGDSWAESMMRTLRASLHLWSGQAAAAQAMAEAARSAFRTIGDRYGELQSLVPLTRALVARGDTAGWHRYVEEAQHLAAAMGSDDYAATLAAGAAAHAGDGERAVREATRALETLKEATGAIVEAEVARGLGALQQGRVEEAQTALRRAADVDPASSYVAGPLALALAAGGDPVTASRSGALVATRPGATYLDRVLAWCAVAIAAAALGDEETASRALGEAIDVADASDDVVARALVTATGALAGRPPSVVPAAVPVPDGWATALAAAAAGARAGAEACARD